MSLPGFLKEVGYRVGGTIIGVGAIVAIVFLGDFLNLGFLQSEGGVLIAAIVLMELFFFGLIIVGVLYGELTG